jgi:hypothetical protein
MGEKQEYKILVGTVSQLEEEATDAINEGWRCQGGPSRGVGTKQDVQGDIDSIAKTLKSIEEISLRVKGSDDPAI